MLYQTSLMEMYNVQAIDDELGGVKDIYIDDEDWVIRYLVVDTRKWLPGKKVLMSPIQFDQVDFINQRIKLADTKENIKEGPSLEEHEPVSRNFEKSLSTYFGWPYYWNGESVWGPYGTPSDLVYNSEKNETPTIPDVREEDHDDFHLRSVDELKGEFSGYKMKAKDGKIGKITDFIVDDSDWKVHYAIVEKNNLLPGEVYLVPVDWIQNIDHINKEVYVDVPEYVFKKGPDFQPYQPLTEDYESYMYRKFQQAEAWKKQYQ